MSPPGSFTRWPVVLLIVAALIPLLLPGDAPFINDEAQMILNALEANREHRLAQVLLRAGALGVVYGPFPTWVYQGLLAISHRLTTVVLLRALLMSAVTAFAFWWIGRTLKLWPWFAAVVLVSPYFWYYSRHLWDNSFCIPLGALALAGYASFLERPSSLSLSITFACFWALLFTHFMALPLIAPIGLHLVFFAPRVLWRHKWSLIAVSVAAILAGFSYCSYLVRDLHSVHATRTAAGWVFPFLGARVLSGYGLGYFFGPHWLLGDAGASALLGRVATLVSTLAFPLVWIGIALAAYSTFRAFRREERWNTRQKIAALALATLGAQIVLNGMTGTARRPHYYNGTWIIFVLFAWLCVDAQAKLRWGRWIVAPYGAAQLAVLGLLVAQIHRNGGSREGYGPTVTNQMQIASQLKDYSPEAPIKMDVLNYQLFPHALQAVRSLDPPDPRRALRNAQLAIVYASPDPKDGRIKLIER